MFTSPAKFFSSTTLCILALLATLASGCNYSPVYNGEFIEVNSKDLKPYWVSDPDTVEFQATQKEIKAVLAGGGYTKGVVWIDSNGKVTQVQITESEPPGVFDSATIKNQTGRTYSPGPDNPERRPAKVTFETSYEMEVQ